MHLPDLNLKYLQKRAEAKKEDKGQLSKIECECRCKNSSAYLSLLEGKGWHGAGIDSADATKAENNRDRVTSYD